jgi:ATP-dependent exoDNAse (exonuclease V) beta subunit
MINLDLDEVYIGTYEHGENKVPSVTQVLKHINEDYIAQWANSLGFKGLGYRRELNKYAVEGTKVHSEIESFLTDGLCMTDPVDKTMGFMSFIQWFNDYGYEKNILIEPIMLEKSLIGKYFCGTIDAVMRIGNEVHIVDYKTSSNIGYKYFMQLSAYRHLLSKIGVNADKLTVLQLNKYESKYKQYTIDIKLNEGLVDNLFNGFINTLNSFNSINLLREIKPSEFGVK